MAATKIDFSSHSSVSVKAAFSRFSRTKPPAQQARFSSSRKLAELLATGRFRIGLFIPAMEP
jgi:hypothetical protein